MSETPKYVEPSDLNQMLAEELQKVSEGTRIPEAVREAAELPTPKEKHVRTPMQRVQRRDRTEPPVDTEGTVPEVQQPEGAAEERTRPVVAGAGDSAGSTADEPANRRLTAEDHLEHLKAETQGMTYRNVAGERTLYQDINVLIEHIEKRIAHFRTVNGM